MFDALSMYIEISPFRIDENWDIQDFNNASAFLREDYKVTNIFKKIISSSFDNEELNTIFEQAKTLYLKLGLIDQDRLSPARAELRNESKNKNSRNKK